MRKILFVLFLLGLCANSFGQTNYEKFTKLFEKNDTSSLKKLLTDWEKSNPNDPEFYTCAMNFYFYKSQKEKISLNKAQSGNQSLQLIDSTGNNAGYINSSLDYDSKMIAKAMEYANKGINIFPDRLDIRFGKSHMQLQIGDYDNFTKELIKTIDYSRVNNNNWLWTENKKQEDAETFFLHSIQSYLKELYDTEDDNLLPIMIQIGEATLKYYKKNIEILSTTSVALLLTKDYDKAIRYLLDAEKINPKDFIVLNNIAQAYNLKGDKLNTIKYYELTGKYGDEQAKLSARKKLNELKK